MFLINILKTIFYVNINLFLSCIKEVPQKFGKWFNLISFKKKRNMTCKL